MDFQSTDPADTFSWAPVVHHCLQFLYPFTIAGNTERLKDTEKEVFLQNKGRCLKGPVTAAAGQILWVYCFLLSAEPFFGLLS